MKFLIITLLLLSIISLYACDKKENKSRRQIISTNLAPKAIGPYSQAVLVHKTLYLSGQIAINPNTNKIIDNDIKSQTKQVMDNINAVLNEAEYSIKHIASVTVFLKSMSDFKDFNQVYKSYFKDDNYPARTTVEVSNLPLNALIEISVIAQK